MNKTNSTRRFWDDPDAYVAPNGKCKESHRQGVNYYKAKDGIRWRIVGGSRTLASPETFKRLSTARNNLRAVMEILQSTCLVNTFAVK